MDSSAYVLASFHGEVWAGSGHRRTPASSSEIGSINTTTTDPTPPSTTSRQPATPPTAPTNNPQSS
jgi:hypothetical protein